MPIVTIPTEDKSQLLVGVCGFSDQYEGVRYFLMISSWRSLFFPSPVTVI